MRRIIAWQLPLFSWLPAKVGYAWRRAFHVIRWAGVDFPLEEAAIRQHELLTPDSRKWEAEHQ